MVMDVYLLDVVERSLSPRMPLAASPRLAERMQTRCMSTPGTVACTLMVAMAVVFQLCEASTSPMGDISSLISATFSGSYRSLFLQLVLPISRPADRSIMIYVVFFIVQYSCYGLQNYKKIPSQRYFR